MGSEGFEPSTNGLKVRCSTSLSYDPEISIIDAVLYADSKSLASLVACNLIGKNCCPIKTNRVASISRFNHVIDAIRGQVLRNQRTDHNTASLDKVSLGSNSEAVDAVLPSGAMVRRIVTFVVGVLGVILRIERTLVLNARWLLASSSQPLANSIATLIAIQIGPINVRHVLAP